MNYFVPSAFNRAIAYTIDSIITGIIIWSIGFLLGVYTSGNWIEFFTQLSRSEFILPHWLVGISGAIVFEISFLIGYGATPGKIMMGLRVVDSSDSREGLRVAQAFIRVLSRYLFTPFFGMALNLLMFYRYDRTHLFDWIASTRVVQLYPRLRPVKRRYIFATIMVVWIGLTNFMSAIKTFQSFKLESGMIRPSDR